VACCGSPYSGESDRVAAVPSVEVEEPIGVGCAATTEVCEDKLAVNANLPDEPLALEWRVTGAAKVAHGHGGRATFRAARPHRVEVVL
jgi:hypothetical protein